MLRKGKRRAVAGLLIVFMVCAGVALTLPAVQVAMSFPAEVRIFDDESWNYPVGPLFQVSVGPGGELSEQFYIAELKLLGRLPLKRALVNVVTKKYVVPGGQAIGIVLNDAAAGIGTLSFWEPQSGVYGALGHPVSVGGEWVEPDLGGVFPAQIYGIQPGDRGRPGEKLGVFSSGPRLGTIEKNTSFGIFGELTSKPSSSMQPVAVALTRDVQLGPAEMLTVIDGESVESFAIEVTAVQEKAKSTGKGLVLRVTDPTLIARTNGIVQGMSGSPILQNGQFIGAVTHVFINDSLRGFGVPAEWMIYEADIPAYSRERAAGDES